tara:strand:- start:24917 stop:25561 length:645 start_codon:yes stop_codon:yes gene_type:complete
MARPITVFLSLLLLGWIPFSFAESVQQNENANQSAIDPAIDHKTAVFAGGCFWCMEPPFDKVPGVISTVSGYAGGHLVAPTYRDVTGGGSGHLEVVQVTYDSARVTYQELLDIFWVNVDPVDGGGQFCDRGESYTTAIFTTTDREQKLAQLSKASVQKILDRPIQTRIRTLESPGFYPAEDYHQDYYQKNPIRYKFYRTSCRRDARLEQLWTER